jgi:hypothetical protein
VGNRGTRSIFSEEIRIADDFPPCLPLLPRSLHSSSQARLPQACPLLDSRLLLACLLFDRSLPACLLLGSGLLLDHLVWLPFGYLRPLLFQYRRVSVSETFEDPIAPFLSSQPFHAVFSTGKLDIVSKLCVLGGIIKSYRPYARKCIQIPRYTNTAKSVIPPNKAVLVCGITTYIQIKSHRVCVCLR